MLQQYIVKVNENLALKKKYLEKLKERAPEHELEPVFVQGKPVPFPDKDFGNGDSDSEERPHLELFDQGHLDEFDPGYLDEVRGFTSMARIMERAQDKSKDNQIDISNGEESDPIHRSKSERAEESNAKPNTTSSTDARDIAQFNLLSRGTSLARADSELLKFWKQEQNENQFLQDESKHNTIIEALNSRQTEAEIQLFIMHATEEKDRIFEFLKQVTDIVTLLNPVLINPVKPANHLQTFLDLVAKNDAAFNEIVRLYKK